MDLLDEVDLAILDIYDMTADAGVCVRQTLLLLRERIELAAQLVDELHDDWPEMISEAVH